MDLIKLKAFAVPAGLFVASLLLYIVGGKLLFGQITATQEKVKKLDEETAVLETKTTVLTNFASVSSNYTGVVSAALPERNSGLVFVTQLKRLAGTGSLVISDIKIGPPTTEASLSKAQLSFNVEGNLKEVLSFLGSIVDVSPVSRIEKVRINQTGTVARAAVTLSVFWADFPQKLPDITEPIKELTNDDQVTINQLSQRSQPLLLRFTPTESSPRSDPFSL